MRPPPLFRPLCPQPLFVSLHNQRAEECLLQAGLTQDQPIYQPLDIEKGNRLRDQMLYFTENSTRSPIHLVGRLSLFLDDLIEFSAHWQKMEAQTQPDFYINEAVVYIQQNYHRDLTIDEVADFCKLNRNYFSRK